MEIFSVLALDDNSNTFMGLMALNLPFKKKIDSTKNPNEAIEKVEKMMNDGY